MTTNNTVFIGKKPAMNYVLAVITEFNSGSKEVVIKARGRAINRAVDVAEIVRTRFVTDVKIKTINIGTETLTSPQNKELKISAIEIWLTK